MESFISAASCCRSPLRAAASRRSRVRATGAGKRERLVMISGTADAGARWPLPLSALRCDDSSGAGAEASGGFAASPRRLVGATTLPPAASASNKSLKPMRSSMGRRPIEDRRQSIRSTESVASGRNASRAASSGARSAPSPNQRAAEGLWPRHGEGEFAVADAPGKTLGETRRRLLAVGRDEFGKGGEQARLRQAVPIDTVEARFGPGCVEVAERSPFLLMVR